MPSQHEFSKRHEPRRATQPRITGLPANHGQNIVMIPAKGCVNVFKKRSRGAPCTNVCVRTHKMNPQNKRDKRGEIREDEILASHWNKLALTSNANDHGCFGAQRTGRLCLRVGSLGPGSLTKESILRHYIKWFSLSVIVPGAQGPSRFRPRTVHDGAGVVLSQLVGTERDVSKCSAYEFWVWVCVGGYFASAACVAGSTCLHAHARTLRQQAYPPSR